MNPQEQNKAKAPFQNPADVAPGVKRDESPKQPAATNIQPGTAGLAKPADKDLAECSTTKGSCGTK